MKQKGGLVAISKQINEWYHVHIIWGDFVSDSKSPTNYYATVTRINDDVQMVFTNKRKWLLGLRIQPWALNRAFKKYDKVRRI